MSQVNSAPAFVKRVSSFLKSNTFFGGLPDQAIAALVRRGHVAKFAKNQIVYRRGETGETLMVILSGQIKISNVNDEAREVIFNFLGPGDVNGEIAVLDGRERTADATALEESEVFIAYRRDLLPVLMAHPQAMLEVIHTLCDRIRTTSGIIEDSALEMKGRMAKALLRLSEQHGRAGKDGIRIALAISQTELGNYMGLSRANVSRLLGWLRDRDIVRIAGSHIVIIDAEGLAGLCQHASARLREER